jgi:demethylspheroidene O-methyltransferase
MIAHHDVLYRDLTDPLDLLASDRPTDLSRFWDYGEKREGAAAYSRLMSASQEFVAEEVLAAWPFLRHRRLLDVGGGDGTFLRAAHRHAPQLQLALFDLPAVARIAQSRLGEEGIPASVHAGSFLDDPLPEGADLLTLNRVLHDHGDEAVRTILRRAYEALAPGGTLLVNEPMAGAGTRRMSDAYFGFYLLAMRQGEPRSAERLSALLMQAGFRKPRLVPTAMPLLVGMIAATR